MNKLTLSRSLSAVLLLSLIMATVFLNISRPRIMILHSYAPTHPWVRDVNKGLARVVEHWADYAISWHYMYVEHPGDTAWLQKAQAGALDAIDKLAPEVLIAIDDPAQAWVAKQYLHHPRLQIVFAGVNSPVGLYGYDQADNIRGILERKPLREVKNMLQLLESSRAPPRETPARLVYLADPSPESRKELPYIDGFEWGPLRYLGSHVAENYAEWQTLITELGKQSDYILVANYRGLRRSASDATFVEAAEVMDWSKIQCAVPLIGLNAFNAEDGATLSLGASPYEQGQVAALMAAEILGRSPLDKNTRFFENVQYVIGMQREGLERWNLTLPSIYSAFSNATGNYFE